MARNSAIASIEDRLDQLKESVRDLVDMGGERASAIKDSMIAGGKKTTSLIKDHPIVAVAIALGIGFVAMRLLRK